MPDVSYGSIHASRIIVLTATKGLNYVRGELLSFDDSTGHAVLFDKTKRFVGVIGRTFDATNATVDGSMAHGLDSLNTVQAEHSEAGLPFAWEGSGASPFVNAFVYAFDTSSTLFTLTAATNKFIGRIVGPDHANGVPFWLIDTNPGWQEEMVNAPTS